MKLFLKYLFCTFLISFPTIFFGQGIPKYIIDVNGKVVSYPDQKGLAGVEVIANGQTKITDHSGNFKMSIGYSGEGRVKLDIRPKNYNIISPCDGLLLLVEDAYTFNIEIKVSSDLSLMKKYSDLVSEFEQMQKDKNVSIFQKNRLIDDLTEKLASSEKLISENNQQIESLKSDNEKYGQKISKLEQKINELEKENLELKNKIFEITEEKFRNKQKYFNEISAYLQDYLIRTKRCL